MSLLIYYLGQRCGMLPKTKEKSDNRLVDRAMLENGLLF